MPGFRLILPLALTVSLALVGGASGAQWIVDDDGPADFRSIQSAINAAYVHTGDTVLVKPGTYGGNVVLSFKDLVIRSEAGPWQTILDAEDSGSVVSLMNRTSVTRIEGFTLQGGRSETGGGVWIFGGGPVVTRNIIQGNRATGGMLGYGYGGGIEIYSSAAVITRNVIRGNTALDGGGGIDTYYSGPSTQGSCCPMIAHNTIVDNLVTAPTGVGGGVLSFASEPHLTSNILAGNQAASGGGIWVEKVQGGNDAPSAPNNILFANTPDDADSTGNWRLPSSSVHADPLLSEGPGTELWPRSSSPALDAAESGLPAWADLTGITSPADSDMDGIVAPDIGALENRSEITGLVLVHDTAPDAARLSWDPSINPAVRFDLFHGDDDPFGSDAGHCLQGSIGVTWFVDATTVPAGHVRHYLVAGRDAIQGTLGMRSDGTLRPEAQSCP